MGLCQARFHFGQAAITGQHLLDLVCAQIPGCTGLDQHRRVGQIPPMLEMGAEQRLADRLLHAVLSSQPQQAMRRQRGYPHLALAEVHRQALGPRGGLGLAKNLLGALGTAELALIGLAQRHRGGVRIRIELERLPVDLEFGRVGAQQLHTLLEAMLADPAPGADHVGVDVDSHPCDMWPARPEKRGRRELSRFLHSWDQDAPLLHHCE
ncbi:hypothetical protein D3C72_1270700 [compost metagenome]